MMHWNEKMYYTIPGELLNKLVELQNGATTIAEYQELGDEILIEVKLIENLTTLDRV